MPAVGGDLAPLPSGPTQDNGICQCLLMSSLEDLCQAGLGALQAKTVMSYLPKLPSVGGCGGRAGFAREMRAGRGDNSDTTQGRRRREHVIFQPLAAHAILKPSCHLAPSRWRCMPSILPPVGGVCHLATITANHHRHQPLAVCAISFSPEGPAAVRLCGCQQGLRFSWGKSSSVGARDVAALVKNNLGGDCVVFGCCCAGAAAVATVARLASPPLPVVDSFAA